MIRGSRPVLRAPSRGNCTRAIVGASVVQPAPRSRCRGRSEVADSSFNVKARASTEEPIAALPLARLQSRLARNRIVGIAPGAKTSNSTAGRRQNTEERADGDAYRRNDRDRGSCRGRLRVDLAGRGGEDQRSRLRLRLWWLRWRW